MFKGRVNRTTYFVTLVAFGLFIFFDRKYSVYYQEIDVLIGLFYLFILAPIAFSLTARRAHDIGVSAWLVFLLSFIPFINFGVAILLIVKRGHQIENKYGHVTSPGINFHTLFMPWKPVLHATEASGHPSPIPPSLNP